MFTYYLSLACTPAFTRPRSGGWTAIGLAHSDASLSQESGAQGRAVRVGRRGRPAGEHVEAMLRAPQRTSLPAEGPRASRPQGQGWGWALTARQEGLCLDVRWQGRQEQRGPAGPPSASPAGIRKQRESRAAGHASGHARGRRTCGQPGLRRREPACGVGRCADRGSGSASPGRGRGRRSVPALLLAGCTRLGTLLSVSVPQFLACEMRCLGPRCLHKGACSGEAGGSSQRR